MAKVTSDAYYEKRIIEMIDEVLDETGQVKDSASEELGNIRMNLYRKRNELRRVFDRIVGKLNKQGYLADIEESFMNGRRVLAVFAEQERMIKGILHGGATATANFNVTAGLALITFVSIMIAGTKKHGFVQHWKNLVPPGLATPVYFLLVPLEFIGMLVRPFALTMRLAANMAGGHIAILAILSFVFIFTEMFASSDMAMAR